jgi:hypothetical protein
MNSWNNSTGNGPTEARTAWQTDNMTMEQQEQLATM